jgi:hypothetical protein
MRAFPEPRVGHIEDQRPNDGEREDHRNQAVAVFHFSSAIRHLLTVTRESSPAVQGAVPTTGSARCLLAR